MRPFVTHAVRLDTDGARARCSLRLLHIVPVLQHSVNLGCKVCLNRTQSRDCSWAVVSCANLQSSSEHSIENSIDQSQTYIHTVSQWDIICILVFPQYKIVRSCCISVLFVELSQHCGLLLFVKSSTETSTDSAQL